MLGRSFLFGLTLRIFLVAVQGESSQAKPSCETLFDEHALTPIELPAEPSPEIYTEYTVLLQTGRQITQSRETEEDIFHEHIKFGAIQSSTRGFKELLEEKVRSIPSVSSRTGLAFKAFVFAVFSGISMPVGVVLGITFAPVSDQLCGRILAFGGGSLLFAVTISIFGKALGEMSLGEASKIENIIAVFAGLVGAAFYMFVLDWLGEEHEEQEGPAGKRRTAKMRDALYKMLGVEKVEARKETGEDAEKAAEQKHAMSVAFSLFAGLLIDGIPEGVFMGLLAAENRLSVPLIISLFIANFPEALSSAALLDRAGMKFFSIMLMWGGLCLLIGLVCGLSCWLVLLSYPGYYTHGELPMYAEYSVKTIEGFTGGAMLACISGLMLPEAHERVGKGRFVLSASGFLAVSGFLSSVAMDIIFHEPVA